MTVTRPGSSVLKPGAREKQRELETVITKYELLLVIGRTRNPDFGSIDQQQLLFRLAECRLCLVRLQRTTWQIDQHEREVLIQRQNNAENEDDDEQVESMLASFQEMLERTRKLYQQPEVAGCSSAVQGEVQVLLETGELFTYCEDHENAVLVYAEAVRLCYKIEDEATEAILTSKLQELQRHADAMHRVNMLASQQNSLGDTNASSERSRLKAAFNTLADENGSLTKDQLQPLSVELGMRDTLTIHEVDEIWRQLKLPAEGKVSFDDLWRWWMSETMYDCM